MPHKHSVNTPTLLCPDTCVLMHSFTRYSLAYLCQMLRWSLLSSEAIAQEWQRNAPRIWKVDAQVVQKEWQFLQQCGQLSLGNVPSLEQLCLSHITPLPVQQTSVQQQEDTRWVRSGLLSQRLRSIDPKDRHVVLCAWAGQIAYGHTSTVLLSWNYRDFHRKTLQTLGIQLHTPDQFFMALWPTHHNAIRHAFAQAQARCLALGLTTLPLAERLRRDKLYQIAKRLA